MHDEAIDLDPKNAFAYYNKGSNINSSLIRYFA